MARSYGNEPGITEVYHSVSLWADGSWKLIPVTLLRTTSEGQEEAENLEAAQKDEWG